MIPLIPCFMIASLVSGQASPVPNGEPVPVAPAVLATPQEDMSALSLDDLIKRLPATGNEWRWNDITSSGIDHPASLEMHKRMDAGTLLTDEQWRTVLTSTGAIRFRSKWPKDMPYAISLTVPRWLGVSQIRVKPDVTDWHSASAGELFVGFSGTFASIDKRDARLGRAIGKLPAENTTVTFSIEVERGQAEMFVRDGDEGKKPKPGVLWKGTLTSELSPVEDWDQAIPAATEAGIDEAVRHAIGAGFREWGEGNKRTPYLVIDPDCAQFPMLATTGLDIKVELLEGDKILTETWLIASNADTLQTFSSRTTGKDRFYGSANFTVEADKPDTSRWTVRLTGDNKHAWMLWHATSMWKGTLTIPWADLVKHEEARVPGGRGGEGSTPYYK